eukprot:COSAG01_NODE_2439_length_7691_cov_15.896470_4_plen_232_part_00
MPLPNGQVHVMKWRVTGRRCSLVSPSGGRGDTAALATTHAAATSQPPALHSTLPPHPNHDDDDDGDDDDSRRRQRRRRRRRPCYRGPVPDPLSPTPGPRLNSAAITHPGNVNGSPPHSARRRARPGARRRVETRRPLQADGRTWGLHALCASGPAGPTAFTCPAWARRFAASGGRRLSLRRREHATLGHLHRAITEAMTTAPRTPTTHHPTYTYTTHTTTTTTTTSTIREF